MKKIGGILAVLTAIMSVLAPVPQLSAAGCANVGSFGAVELSLPETPDGKMVLWVRMQSDDGNGRVMADIDGRECLEVGDQTKPGEWAWQTAGGDSPRAIDFAAVKVKRVRIIGVTDVKIDRVLLAQPGCVPTDFGNNCRNSVELSQPPTEVTVLPPPYDHPVSGKVVLSQTPAQNKDRLKTVEYIVAAKVVQRAAADIPFDTQLLPNGKHTVQIDTTLDDGTVLRESTVIDVNNPENVFTPLVRWAKQNARPLKFAALTAGGVLAAILVMMWLRRTHRKKRHRMFRGF